MAVSYALGLFLLGLLTGDPKTILFTTIVGLGLLIAKFSRGATTGFIGIAMAGVGAFMAILQLISRAGIA